MLYLKRQGVIKKLNGSTFTPFIQRLLKNLANLQTIGMELKKSAQRARISVVIPMYNAAGTIEECLESLSRMNFPKKGFEAIVVNDGSKDNSLGLARRIVKRNFNFRLLDLGKNFGKITAREQGVKAAKYSLIAFIDADCKADKNWLKELANSGSRQVIGITFNNPKRSKVDLFFHLVRKKYYYWPSRIEEVSWGNFHKAPKGTENFLCDKKLFLECSPKIKGRTVNDDTLIMANILKKKAGIVMNPSANVTHLERDSLEGVFKQWQLRALTFWNYFIQEQKKQNQAFGIFALAWVFLAALTWLNPLFLVYLAAIIAITDFFSSLYFIEKPGQWIQFWRVGIVMKAGFASGIIKSRKKFWKLWTASLLAILILRLVS